MGAMIQPIRLEIDDAEAASVLDEIESFLATTAPPIDVLESLLHAIEGRLDHPVGGVLQCRLEVKKGATVGTPDLPQILTVILAVGEDLRQLAAALRALENEPPTHTVRRATARQAIDRGRVSKKRSVMANQPVIAGTRIRTEAIWNFYRDGYSVKEILDQYPSLSEEDVRAAIEFEQRRAATR